jgi:rhamnosyltransferase
MNQGKNSDFFDNQLVAGVVVLYNPNEKVVENINSYLTQVSHLYIIDNSKSINQPFEIFSDNRKVEYIFSRNNLGIAAALNIAVDRAIDVGYNFLLTMDQDSYFEEGQLEKLISHINIPESFGIVSPFHKNKFFTNPPVKDVLEEVSDVMTSGNILNLSAVKKTGKFREDYFIDYVDIEYCLRLRKNGYKIFRDNNSFLVHNEANLSRKRIFGVTIYPPNHSALRWYYKVRNYFYLKKEYQKTFKDYFKNESRNIFGNILKVLLFEKDKIGKIRMMLKGYYDFRKNVKGKFSS